MPFASFKDILKIADDNGFAVAAVNIFNIESAAWLVKAAEIEKIPVICMLYPDPNSFIPMSAVSFACRALAERATVPVGVHLDHCKNFEIAVSGIPLGYQSIMIDGSELPFEENIKITKSVVDCARIFDVDVEAELGCVGSNSSEDELFDKFTYTNPDDVVEFINQTGVDALAVAIGNSHGKYVCEPRLDISRLDEINTAVSVPLVLHGGSGIPKEQMIEAIKHGINKVNIGTDFFAKYKEVIGKHLSVKEGFVLRNIENAGEEMIEFARGKLRVLNPGGYKVS
ncbi:MAG: class II fructose-bisphosphate aldolase [Oscillospiraceae bacterium]|jgi:fructose-bisphosphate aldolase class II/tagatose 1,6-diphosphate aldolase GatY/KbaY|nr:class II fructose-bisphosphate aldolase [Oscillospiraceae bacterium]